MLELAIVSVVLTSFVKPLELWCNSLNTQGAVVTVTSRSITILKDDGVRRRFPASVALAQGQPGEEMGRWAYPLYSVRVGDRVDVKYDRNRAGKVLCTAVCIRRRPGGQVPPPLGRQLGNCPWNAYANICQLAEEAGLPVPSFGEVMRSMPRK